MDVEYETAPECPDCGSDQTAEIVLGDMSVTVCAGCGSDQ